MAGCQGVTYQWIVAANGLDLNALFFVDRPTLAFDLHASLAFEQRQILFETTVGTTGVAVEVFPAILDRLTQLEARAKVRGNFIWKHSMGYERGKGGWERGEN